MRSQRINNQLFNLQNSVSVRMLFYMDLSFCSCSLKLNTAKHSKTKGQADKNSRRKAWAVYACFVLGLLGGNRASDKH